MWVYLQIEAIWEECYKDEDICRALDSLPNGLDETYDRCLARIGKKPETLRQFAPYALRWVACASRPLLEKEIEEAVAFDLTDKRWDPAKIPPCSAIIESCANLIFLDATDHCVHFAHASVSHFLLNKSATGTHYFTEGLQRIRLFCGEYSVNYLTFSDFSLQVQPMMHTGFTAELPHPIAATNTATASITSTLAHIIWPKQSSASSLVRVPFTLRSRQMTPHGVGRYGFLQYARQNWASDTREISPKSLVWHKFKSLALQENVSWKLHPWVSSGQSLISHYHGLLGCAVQLGHLPLLKLLFLSEASNASSGRIEFSQYCNLPLNAPKGGLSAFHVACRLGYLEIVRILLPYSKVNNQDEYGNTALHYAGEKGHVDVAKLILAKKDTKVGLPNNENETPIWLATTYGHAEMVALLLQHKAKFTINIESGHGLLDIAAIHGHIDVIKILLPLVSGSSSVMSLERALFLASRAGQGAVVTLLTGQFGIDSNLRHGSGNTLLMTAAQLGQIYVAQHLLSCGADIEACNDMGQTALHMAVSHDHPEIAMLLLSRGAKVDVEDRAGSTPLHLLTGDDGDEHMVLRFHRAGADFQARDKRGKTPLHYAAANGLTEKVQSLVNNKCDIDSTGRENAHDLLQLSPLRRLEPIIRRVMFRHVICQSNHSGLTPLHLATTKDHPSTLVRLLQFGANPNAKSDVSQLSPLHFAALSMNVPVAERLIDWGAIVDVRNAMEATPLHVAVMMGDVLMIATLIKSGANPDATMNFHNGIPMSAFDIAGEKWGTPAAAALVKAMAFRLIRDHSRLTYRQAEAKDFVREKRLFLKEDTNLDRSLCCISNKLGYVTLSVASLLKDLESMRLLLKRSYDVNILSINGNSLLSFAIITCDNEEAALLLLTYRADPNGWFHNTWPMLRLAVLFNRRQTASALLDKGANIVAGPLLSQHREGRLSWHGLQEALDLHKGNCPF